MIKFVYFDIGGVVIKDFSETDKWEKMKRDIGIPLNKDKEFDKFYDIYERKVDLGLEVDSLIPLIKKKFGVRFSDNYSILEDFINRFEKNCQLEILIRKIHKNYKVGLLTNMYPGMLLMLNEKDLMPDISWDSIVDSSVERCGKPDRKVFEIAEKRAGFNRSDILFVDNNQRNIEAANLVGWKTFLYDSSDYEKSAGELEKYLYKNIIQYSAVPWSRPRNR